MTNKRKKVEPENEFETCIYCGSFDFDYNKDNDGLWRCNSCGEEWED